MTIGRWRETTHSGMWRWRARFSSGTISGWAFCRVWGWGQGCTPSCCISYRCWPSSPCWPTTASASHSTCPIWLSSPNGSAQSRPSQPRGSCCRLTATLTLCCTYCLKSSSGAWALPLENCRPNSWPNSARTRTPTRTTRNSSWSALWLLRVQGHSWCSSWPASPTLCSTSQAWAAASMEYRS